jgi:hypothetical protein
MSGDRRTPVQEAHTELEHPDGTVSPGLLRFVTSSPCFVEWSAAGLPTMRVEGGSLFSCMHQISVALEPLGKMSLVEKPPRAAAISRVMLDARARSIIVRRGGAIRRDIPFVRHFLRRGALRSGGYARRAGPMQ